MKPQDWERLMELSLDQPDASWYCSGLDENGDMIFINRNAICARCDKVTNNTSQGHYWSFCKITGDMRGHHFCCPGDCELETT